MAFFGLTALGPQDSFRSSLLGEPTLHLFDESDFREAFDRVASDEANSDSIPPGRIPDVLEIVYRGPPPDREVERLTAELASAGDEELSWRRVRDALLRLRDEAERAARDPPGEEGADGGGRYGSYQQYRDATRRHVRTKFGPSEVLARTLTSNQEFGWEAARRGGDGDGDGGMPARCAIRGRKSCPETLYASELVKSGIIY